MHLRFLRNHYDIVPLSRIVSAMNTDGSPPPQTCVITFDDGWRNVYEHAFPILRSMSIPATMFLTTGYMEGGAWHWEERARYLMALVHGERDRIRNQDTFRDVRMEIGASALSGLLSVRPSRLPIYVLAKIRELKSWNPGQREQTLELLERSAADLHDAKGRPFLNWAEVREMADCGIEFGTHTSSHPVLPDLTDVEVTEEVRRAMSELERQTRATGRDFAYPFGKHDARVARLVRGAGCTSACTTRQGFVRPGADVFALNRVNISSEVASTQPLFAGRLLCL
jgi:hypothetical protein